MTVSRKIQCKLKNPAFEASVALAKNFNRLGSFLRRIQHIAYTAVHGNQKPSNKLNSICRNKKNNKNNKVTQGLCVKICSSFLRWISTFLIPLNTRKHILITLKNLWSQELKTEYQTTTSEVVFFTVKTGKMNWNNSSFITILRSNSDTFSPLSGVRLVGKRRTVIGKKGTQTYGTGLNSRTGWNRL